MFNQGKNHKFVFACASRHDDEEVVQGGLAVTPAQMLEMAEHGIPITPSNLAIDYVDGVSKLDFEPPMDYQRGMDISDIWERSLDIQQKFKKGLKNVGSDASKE